MGEGRQTWSAGEPRAKHAGLTFRIAYEKSLALSC